MIQEEINSFRSYLLVEKKYSKNTIESYERDLLQFQSFITKEITRIQEEDIHQYLKELSVEGKSEKTISRVISCLKSFYKFLLIEKKVARNPMENIEIPKLKKSLPHTLTEEEVNNLLEVPLLDAFSYRNKAMLEGLYATGIRVSELVNLKLGDIDIESATLRTMGKGSKERIVPLGDYALRYLTIYIRDYRPMLLKRDYNDYLFLNLEIDTPCIFLNPNIIYSFCSSSFICISLTILHVLLLSSSTPILLIYFSIFCVLQYLVLLKYE